MKILSIRAEEVAGECRICENGAPCAGNAYARGLCKKHYQRIKDQGRLSEFALPKRNQRERRHSFSVKPPHLLNDKQCRVTVNDVPCTRPAEQRGLCIRHHRGIYQRPDLDLDDYALPRGAQAHSGRPPQRFFSVKKKPNPRFCRLIENGVACQNPVHARGICEHHYNVLDKQERERLAAPKRKTRRQVTFKADHDLPAEVCVVREDGERCQHPPSYRGVCEYHRQIIGNLRGRSLRRFFRPDARMLERKPNRLLQARVCCIIDDGRFCESPAFNRGMCRPHYRYATRKGLIEELGNASKRTGAAPPDRARHLVHVYLDKNILFDAADHAIFGSEAYPTSQELIALVKQERLQASVSADALKSAYNHVRHRLQRPRLEGGREQAAGEADQAARQWLQGLLNGGLWLIIPLPATDFLTAVHFDDDVLSLEDRLEWTTFLYSKTLPSAPTLFLTRDSDFAEGVPPHQFLEEWQRRAGSA